MRGAQVAVGLLGALLAGCASGPFGVALTLHVDDSVDDSTLSLVKTLRLQSSGDETFAQDVPFSGELLRDERTIYRPEPGSRSLTLSAIGLDASGAAVLTGSTAKIDLSVGELTFSELTLLRSYRQEVMSDDPLLYYRLDEMGGAVAFDASGHAHSAAFSGAFAFQQPGALRSDPSTAVALTAPASWLVVNDIAPVQFVGTAPFTLEIFLKPVAYVETWNLLFSVNQLDPTTGRQHYGAFVHQDQGAQFERVVDGNYQSVATMLPPLDVFTHFVCTYDGTALSLYINGAVVGTTPDTRSANPANTPLYIGNGGPGWTALNGVIDEPAVYDHALTADRVRAHYEASTR
jgi:hypothetical protein